MAGGLTKNRRRAKADRASGQNTPDPQPSPPSSRELVVAALPSEKARLACAASVFVAALLLYGWTLAPTVTLVDSGELIVAARVLGVAHPPGFPLYVLLAHLATYVPIGSIAARVNFASALFAALGCAMLTLVVAELITNTLYLRTLKRPPKKKTAQRSRGKTSSQVAGAEVNEHSIASPLFILAPALMSGLLMACSRTLWTYATIAEVYTLNTLLILIIFFLMLRWRRAILEDERRAGTDADYRSLEINDDDWLLYAAALTFGLALGVHHVTVALTIPALALLVYRTEGLRFFTSKRVAYAALFSFIALLAIYAYLPLAASRSPIINWGNPRAFEQIWWHITGKQYQAFLTFSPEVMGQQIVEFGRIAAREFGPWWLPAGLALALTGFIAAYRRDRATFWFLALVVIGNMAYALNYDIAEDKDAYYLPTFVAFVMAAGLGMWWLIQIVASRAALAKRAFVLAALPVLLVPPLALAGNLPFNNRSRYLIAHDYVNNILSTVEPNGLLLTLDWQVQSPMLYTREIEQRRRDVKVVDVNLLRRSWYFDYLRRSYPDLIERSHDPVEAFVADLKQWEQNPEAYAKDMALTKRINTRFHEMILSFVAKEMAVAPVYLTSDMVFKTEAQDAELTGALSKTYQFVPQGLVFKLYSDRAFHDPGDVHLETRGLADGTLKFEKDDVVNVKVLPVYTIMLTNRGRYLALFNQHERAIEAFKQALALDPNLTVARQGLDESMNKLRSPETTRP